MKHPILITLLAVGGLMLNVSALAETIFECKTTNGKQIKLLDNGKTLQYSFGKVGKPEIVLNVARQDARYYDWRGVGRAISYAIEIPNGEVAYNIEHAYDRFDQKYSGGVTVTMPNDKFVTIECKPNGKIISKLEEVQNIPSGYE